MQDAEFWAALVTPDGLGLGEDRGFAEVDVLGFGCVAGGVALAEMPSLPRTRVIFDTLDDSSSTAPGT
jgi:hypothetical protein